VALTGTFLITTTLFLVVARALWRWTAWRVVLFRAAGLQHRHRVT
jgi:KUP system potassium uptake protein